MISSQNDKCFGQSCRENRSTHFIFDKFSLWKSYRLWDNVEKYVGARQATDDNTIWRIVFVCWIPKATNTHSEYVILTAFQGNNSYANAPQYYVLRTFPLLLSFWAMILCAHFCFLPFLGRNFSVGWTDTQLVMQKVYKNIYYPFSVIWTKFFFNSRQSVIFLKDLF